MRTPSVALLLCAGLAFASLSCSKDGDKPTDPTPPVGGSNAVTATIPPAGGSLTANAGGASVRLDVPPGAVGVPIDLTLRPAAAADGAFFALQLEPAGLVFLDLVTLTVTVPDGVALADQHLFFGDPTDAIFIPTTVDTPSRTLTTSIRSFGIPLGDVGIATRVAPPNNLGGQPATCAQVLADAQTRFDAFVAQEDYSHAIETALESAALLQGAACSEAQVWITTVADLTCTRFEAAITNAQSTSISGYGDFDASVGPIINWAGVAQLLSPDCPSLNTYLTAIEAEVDDFLAWYGPVLQSMNSPNFATFVALKQELLRLFDLMTVAMTLGVDDAAQRIESQGMNPTLDQMRAVAYALGANDTGTSR